MSSINENVSKQNPVQKQIYTNLNISQQRLFNKEKTNGGTKLPSKYQGLTVDLRKSKEVQKGTDSKNKSLMDDLNAFEDHMYLPQV